MGSDCPPVELRRSRRARRFSLKVSHTERAAILTLPQEVKMEEAGNFLARHKDWLKRQMDRLPEPVPFVDDAIIPLRGVSYRISYVGALRYQGVVWVEEADAVTADARWDTIEICKQNSNVLAAPKVDTRVLPRICVSGGEKHGSRRLADWLRSQAKCDLTRRTLHHASNLGCQPKRISVRDQSTRWGSCSSTGTISYSWRLIFAPDYVLDYVAAHEVAHLREMNHVLASGAWFAKRCPKCRKPGLGLN
ncbi:MAG: M48 family metallopeptidase [Rhodomicrobium sp.]|nr:M48 family metallopeptidase [Rhodomicrobium sp.]